MTPYKSHAAVKNLRAGIKKMESTMTPAAQVRREFRLGRPPKPVETVEPLQRTVVWRKATEALSNIRDRMVAAKLKPEHVSGAVVYVETGSPDESRVLPVQQRDKTLEESQAAAYEILGRDDVIALGMIFTQYDEHAGKLAVFPFQFMPLNERGIAVLRQAATEAQDLVANLKNGAN
jgi:hypothetical protein